jgi:hypothetical protein
MQKMNKKTWIAVTVAIFVVGFFMFGGDIIGFFQGKDTTQVASTENATNFMPQSVVVQDVVTGTGDEVVNGALLSVHYVGMLSDGKVFDSSLARRQPFEFIYGGGQVISGLEQGMAGMKVGARASKSSSWSHSPSWSLSWLLVTDLCSSCSATNGSRSRRT